MTNKNIYSNRLLIRGIQHEDIQSIYSYRSHKDIAKYQYWEPFTIQDTVDFVNKCVGVKFNINGEWMGMAILTNNENRLIGDCSVKIDGKIAELGCNISKDYQKKGYAQEALSLVMEFLFENTQVLKVIGITDAENNASIALMLALGMYKDISFERKVMCKGKLCIEHKYSIKKERFKQFT